MNPTELERLRHAAQKWRECRDVYQDRKVEEDRARSAREAACSALRKAEEDLVDLGFVGEHKPVRTIVLDGGTVVIRHHPNCTDPLVSFCGPDGEVKL